MTIPPDDTRLTRINRMLREIGRIGQEIKREETEQDAKRRDTDGVVKTASKELSAVIHFLETHRF